MKIEIFGSGCSTCKKLFELTKQATTDLKLETKVEYITDIQKMIEIGVMSSPVLVIDGKVALAGQVPDVEKIKEIIYSKKSSIDNFSSDCSCDGNC